MPKPVHHRHPGSSQKLTGPAERHPPAIQQVPRTPAQTLASNSPQVLAAHQFQAKVSQHVGPPLQLHTPNGLPPALLQNMELASGLDLSGVRVHRNSSMPAQLQAHAYAQGNQIHLAPGQERHLPHEAWHVVQQAQGRVRPTHQMQGVALNLDRALESEAANQGDRLADIPLRSDMPVQRQALAPVPQRQPKAGAIVQRVAAQIFLSQKNLPDPSPPPSDTADASLLATPTTVANDASLNKEKGTLIGNKRKADALEDKDTIDPKTDTTITSTVTDKAADTDATADAPLDSKAPPTKKRRGAAGPIPPPRVSTTISKVLIAGRPKSVFKGTIGDHVTAFAVHQKGLETALVGKTLLEAAEFVLQLTQQTKDLPGRKKTAPTSTAADVDSASTNANNKEDLKVLDQPEEEDDDVQPIKNRSGRKGESIEDTERRISKRLDNFEQLVGDAGTVIKDEAGPRPAHALSMLQAMVANYLELRELVPLSVLNIKKSASAALAGKGKAEAFHVAILQKFESDQTAHGIEELRAAILGLIDIQGLAILGSEYYPDLIREIAPFTKTDENTQTKDLIEPFLQQHLLAIQMAFPKAAKASGMEPGKEEAMDLMWDAFAPAFQSKIKASIERVTKEQDDLKKLSSKTDLKKGKAKAKAKEDPSDQELNSLSEQLSFFQNQQSIKFGTAAKSKPANKADAHPIDSKELPKFAPVATAVAADDAAREASKDLSSGNFAVSIDLSRASAISRVHVQGRPSSPHSGTEGAHTTAWVVIIDALNARLRDKPLSKAPDILLAMIDETLSFEKEMAAQGVSHKKNQAAVDQARIKDITGQIKDAKTDEILMSEVQALIAAYLSLVNHTPGASFDVGNTNGKAEAKSLAQIRAIGRDASGGKSSNKIAVKEALRNLLDLDAVINSGKSEAKDAIILRHIDFLTAAYPDAMDFAFGKRAKKPKIAAYMAEEVSKDEDYDVQNRKKKPMKRK